jgi:hypothetical protein
LVERSLGQLQRHDRVHQPLLRAVVQVADHATTGLVGLGDETRSRGGELVAGVGVRDRGVEELSGSACASQHRTRPSRR